MTDGQPQAARQIPTETLSLFLNAQAIAFFYLPQSRAIPYGIASHARTFVIKYDTVEVLSNPCPIRGNNANHLEPRANPSP
ncbi:MULTISPECIES: hypothetical protein [unclassified Microcoleus]|uniref:hypothetical protein n=1 Tax=unclassified Microcoleus TaxID=2642155 RepID=UPI002FD58321